MTVRFVACEFCNRLNDYHVMFMCPVCRKTICNSCRHDGPLKPGQCARKTPCDQIAAPSAPLPRKA